MAVSAGKKQKQFRLEEFEPRASKSPVPAALNGPRRVQQAMLDRAGSAKLSPKAPTFKELQAHYEQAIRNLASSRADGRELCQNLDKKARLLTIVTITKWNNRSCFNSAALSELLKTIQRNPQVSLGKVQSDPQVLLRATFRRLLTGRPGFSSLSEGQRKEVVERLADHALVNRLLADNKELTWWFGRIQKEVANEFKAFIID